MATVVPGKRLDLTMSKTFGPNELGQDDRLNPRAADVIASPASPFDYQPRTRLIFGPDSVERVGELARGLGRKILLVTDAGIVAAGHAERVQRILEAAGLTVALYGKARENPTTRDVDECLAVAKSAGIDMLIGL